MLKILRNTILTGSAALTAVLVANAAMANEAPAAAMTNEVPATATTSVDSLAQLNEYSREGQTAASMGQVTSVSQLTDVKPTDWAFQALQSLVERYGCIVGYPDRTYKGNRPLSRFEFAAGLNACLDRVNELIAAATADLVTKEDLAVLQKLQEEFAAELATLRGRVDALEARTSTLEAQQFSTTTKLQGEAIFAISNQWNSGSSTGLTGGAPYPGLGAGTFPVSPISVPSGSTLIPVTVPAGTVVPSGPAAGVVLPVASVINPDGSIAPIVPIEESSDNNAVFQNRVRLTLNTSFTGSDLLVTRLAAGNGEKFQSNTIQGSSPGLQTWQFGNTGDDNVVIDWLAYYTSANLFNIPFKGYIAAAGGLLYDFAPTASPFDTGDSGTSTLTVFGQRNPIYAIGGGSGLGLTYKFGGEDSSSGFAVTAGYLANSGGFGGSLGANDPRSASGFGPGGGLFGGNYSALLQVGYVTEDQGLQVAATYVNSYQRTGAIFGFGGGLNSAVGSYYANQSPSGILLGGSAAAQVNAYGLSAAYKFNPNLFVNGFFTYANTDFINDGKGNQEIWTYGIGVGLPDFGKPGNLLGLVGGAVPYRIIGSANQIPFQVEAFYKYQLNDKISITPGVIWVSKPDQTNGDAWIGTIRTTFTF